MKKLFSLFLILCFWNYFYLPALSAEKNIKKPRACVFNRAVKKGDIDKVDSYIKAGFNPNKTYWGTSIITTAIDNKQNDMLDFLLKNGASSNPQKSQVQPLFYAVVKNNPYAVKRLLEAGADQNKTFMRMTAQQLATNKSYIEIIEVFENFNQAGNVKVTNIEDAISLMEVNPITKPFYLILKGENVKHKPFKITYANMSLFYDANLHENILATTRLDRNGCYIYVNKNLKQSSKEALATLIASQVFHTDKKDSINEEAYSALVMATVWHSFILNNPKLKNENSLLVQTLNEYESNLIENDYDIAKFKEKIASNPTYIYLKLPEESPHFTNKILSLPKDKTIYDKVKISLQNYWNSTTTSEKVYNVCYFVAYAAVVIGTSYLLNTTVQQSTFTTLRINSF